MYNNVHIITTVLYNFIDCYIIQHPNKLPGYDQKYDGPLYKVCNNGKGTQLHICAYIVWTTVQYLRVLIIYTTLCNECIGEGLFHVRSKYDQYYHDRVWDWKCHKVAASPLTDCSWSPYINNWKQPITYMCPKNKFMTGRCL